MAEVKAPIHQKYMPKRMTVEEFRSKSELIYGKGTLDYSCVEIVNNHTPVTLICPIHGPFCVTPNAHLQGSVSCRKCKKDFMRELIYGHGINDSYKISEGGKHDIAYKMWMRVLERCYDEKWHRKKPTYARCVVSEEWLIYSNFKRWFDENYIEGYALDKDILVKGNKVYGPDTCCFVPNEINILFQNPHGKENKLPRGVSIHKGRIIVRITRRGKAKEFCGFKTIAEASKYYSELKRQHIIDVANEYWNKDLISKRVYLALINNADYYG